MKATKWTERKWLIGATAFITLILLTILDANNVLIMPDSVSYLLTGIVMTWLVTEGYLDHKKISQDGITLTKSKTPPTL